MAKKKTVADQSKSGHVSSFTGGLNTDLHPMLQPNDTLTDCVNGTLITYNGNENMLQNDMGNYELKHAQLPEGYIPMGMKEHQGILYIASWNPFTKRAQIGSYPSPKTRYENNHIAEYHLEPFEVNELTIKNTTYRVGSEDIELTDEHSDDYTSNLAKVLFGIADPNTEVTWQSSAELPNYVFEKIDTSKSEIIFTDNFSEETTLGMGDKYQLDVKGLSKDTAEDDFQKFKYFIIDKDKNRHDVTSKVQFNTCSDSSYDTVEIKEDLNDLNPVLFDNNGWLGARYDLKPIETPDVDVSIVENNWTAENIVTNVQISDNVFDVKYSPITEVFQNSQNPRTVPLPFKPGGNSPLKINSDGSYDDTKKWITLTTSMDDYELLEDYASSENILMLSKTIDDVPILNDKSISIESETDNSVVISYPEHHIPKILNLEEFPCDTTLNTINVGITDMTVSSELTDICNKIVCSKNCILGLRVPKLHEGKYQTKELEICLYDAENIEDVKIFVKNLRYDNPALKESLGITHDITIRINQTISVEDFSISSVTSLPIGITFVGENVEESIGDGKIKYDLDNMPQGIVWWNRECLTTSPIKIYKISCVSIGSPGYNEYRKGFDRIAPTDLNKYVIVHLAYDKPTFDCFVNGVNGTTINIKKIVPNTIYTNGDALKTEDYKDLDFIKDIDFSYKDFSDVKLTGSSNFPYKEWQYSVSKNLISLELFGKITSSLAEDFGIIFNTLVFKDTVQGLSCKWISASINDIETLYNRAEDDGTIPMSEVKNIISLSTEYSDNGILLAKVIPVKKGVATSPAYLCLSKNLQQVSAEIEQADSYIIDGVYGKLVGDSEKAKVLLLEPKRLFGKDGFGIQNIGIQMSGADIRQYKYWKNNNILYIDVEWNDYINHAGAKCYIKDIQGRVVKQLVPGIGSTDVYETSFSLEDLTTEGAYIFEYSSDGTNWRRPIFLNTILSSKEALPYSDYKDACYDELVSEQRTLTPIIEDVPNFDQFQIVQKTNNNTFTHDSSYISERKCGFWWSMMDEVKVEGDSWYFGTRLYKKVRFSLKDYGFVKDKTTFSVSVNAPGYDKETFVRNNSKYSDNDSEIFECIVPVVENKQKVTITNEQVYPYTKQYLIQDTFPSLDNTEIFSKEDDPDGEKTTMLGKICGWDTPKMLYVDKLDGENNDCRIAWANPKKYNDSSKCFENGDIVSGEGGTYNKIQDNLKSMFVPIVARIKSNDNGFVFPVPENPKWIYAEKYIEARNKKNSDNKRNLRHSSGIRSIVCTKNNMAAAITNLVMGIAQLLAVIGTWIAALGAFIATLPIGGVGAIPFVFWGCVETVSIGAIGISQFTAGLTELLRKEKTFKIIAIRGKDRLLLPLLGQQDDLDKFAGQARYETDITPKKNKDSVYASFGEIEKMMYTLGSRIYAKKYHKSADGPYKKPEFDSTHTTTKTYFTINLTAQNCELQCGEYSINALDKMFSEIWGIKSNNFTSKTSPSLNISYKFDNVEQLSVNNCWIDSEDSKTKLSVQCSKDFCVNTNPNDVNKCYVENEEVFSNDILMQNLIPCIWYDNLNNVFFYHEQEQNSVDVDSSNLNKWVVTDAKWAFGPNRGGCAMRLIRNFYRGKDSNKVSKDRDYIVNGEYPVFSTLPPTPIAYPIIPTNLRGDNAFKKDNYFNSYYQDGVANERIVYVKDLKDITPVITADCINYLKFVYYAQL